MSENGRLWNDSCRAVCISCGNGMTIADLSCIRTIISVNEFARIDAEKYSQLTQWIERMSQLLYYEEKCAYGSRALQAAVIQLPSEHRMEQLSSNECKYFMFTHNINWMVNDNNLPVYSLVKAR